MKYEVINGEAPMVQQWLGSILPLSVDSWSFLAHNNGLRNINE